ncbi:restriction endonuclease [Microbispora sp. H10670]|uniref:restriction endonuclease n=1 Tax=Microbispora sp. H10670 TaxID=2729108 RepID=UPI0015FFBDDF|nr:restriction endonuclease [Microbispora sp. H10670]
MGRPRRRRGKGKGGDGSWILWLAAAVAAILAVKRLVELIVAHWLPALGVTIVLVAGTTGALVFRYRALEARRQEWIRENARLEKVDRMSGGQFETLVEALLLREGFRKVHRVGGSGDGGVDVVGISPGGQPFVVQCKRWSKSVGAPEIRDLLGALHAHPGHRGVLVTTARFTVPAVKCAAGTDLVLIDRDQLATWLAGSFTLAPAPGPNGWPRLRRRTAPPPAEGELGLGGVLGD